MVKIHRDDYENTTHLSVEDPDFGKFARDVIRRLRDEQEKYLEQGLKDIGWTSPDDLPAHDRKVAAEAWDEGATAAYNDDAHGNDDAFWRTNPYRADRIEQGSCQHEGGTGCPETRGGAHYYSYLDSTERRTCIDCGAPEAPTREDQS